MPNNKKGGGVLKNLIKWWPIIKEDYDWDYTSILELLEFKLNKMAEYFESENAITLEAEKEAKEMKEAAFLCRKLIDDNFFDFEIWDKWHSKPCNKDGQFPPLVLTEEQQKEYEKDMQEIHEKEALERQETLNQLCEILRTRLFGWWD